MLKTCIDDLPEGFLETWQSLSCLGRQNIDQRVADALRPQLDGLVALAEVDVLWALGVWYQRFEPVNDHTVLLT